MRPYRIGIRSGTRALACSSRTATGSGRSAGGAHRAWLDRDADLRRSRPLARHSSGVSTSCGGARTPGLILLTRAPILDRRMLSANSAKAYGHLKASAPSKLYGQAAITHSADGCGDTGWPEVLAELRHQPGHGFIGTTGLPEHVAKNSTQFSAHVLLDLGGCPRRTTCLEGRFAQRVVLPVRRSAGVPGDPGVTVSSRR